ncbi:hypothetical protein E1B28_012001 [Marasmius oreades]|uniref:Uncharacterized protein n=1 Tax=Marasmius oreades TaxID=181124 RepID=A0A9P7RQR2_9AGAR|nr:uncharacterized protein E1B28_012001 [Marasmius oreades]KAG7087960.1 hypothetical protein E1B28_012001 [Marasmius oreades]
MFNNSSRMNFGNANLSIVHGNQNNMYYLQHEHQVAGPGEEEWKVKLHREYDRFPAGRIKILETFTENRVWRGEYEDESVNLSWDERWDSSRAKRTTHLACLVKGMKESLPFFSIAYTGPDAQKVFKRDCLRYSRNRYGNVAQLRGFNDSDIPMVLFHEELIPVQHIQRHHKYSTALQCYLSFQASIAMHNMPEWCRTERINLYHWYHVWIQPRNGRVSFGPAGPRPDFFPVGAYPDWQLKSCSDIPVLHPATYNADCITEHLIKYCPDHFFLDVLASTGTRSNMYPKTEDWPRHTCHVWDRFSGRSLARFRSGWTYKIDFSFAEELLHSVTMEDGRTRFSINSATAWLQMQEEIPFGFTYEIDLPWHQQRHGWLSQACSIFNTLNIPKDKWSDYHFVDLVYLGLNLGTLDHDVEGDFDAITPNIANESNYYLFLLPPPPSLPGGFPDIHAWMSGKNLYYYSLDPNGKSVMTETQCLSFRLPPIVPNFTFRGYSWNSDVYDLISAWQEKKGFDPTTTEFTRSLGYPIMEVIYSMDDGRFEDLFENTDSLSSHTDRVGTGHERAMDIDMPTPFPHLPGIGSVSNQFQPTGDDEMIMVNDSSFMDTAMEVD